MSGVFSAAATDVLALDATDVFSADTTDVFSAAKAAEGGSCPAITSMPGLAAGILALAAWWGSGTSKNMVLCLIGTLTALNWDLMASPGSKLRGKADGWVSSTTGASK